MLFRRNKIVDGFQSARKLLSRARLTCTKATECIKAWHKAALPASAAISDALFVRATSDNYEGNETCFSHKKGTGHIRALDCSIHICVRIPDCPVLEQSQFRWL
jgi:hypothetical protein